MTSCSIARARSQLPNDARPPDPATDVAKRQAESLEAMAGAIHRSFHDAPDVVANLGAVDAHMEIVHGGPRTIAADDRDRAIATRQIGPCHDLGVHRTQLASGVHAKLDVVAGLQP